MQKLIQFDQNEATSFANRPFATEHRLHEHRLLQLPALIALAQKLPASCVETNSGRAELNQSPHEVAMLEMKPDEAMRRIEEEDAWLVLKSVEQFPEYHDLIAEVLNDAAQQLGYASLQDADIRDLRGFIFVSSAHGVTPFHLDYEQNFFVHIHGDKTMHIFDNRDRKLVPEPDIEILPNKHRNLTYHPDFEERAMRFQFKAGQGVFVPFAWPHWVRTGAGYTISMQITFCRRQEQRMIKLLSANGLLRRFGYPQSAPGVNPRWDQIKIAAYSAARILIDPIRSLYRRINMTRDDSPAKDRYQHVGDNA